MLGRRWRQGRRIASQRSSRLLLTAVLVGGALLPASCGGSSSTPQSTLKAFLSDWNRRDWPAMKSLVADPPADFASVNADVLTALGGTAPRFLPGRVTQHNATASARVIEMLTVAGAGHWTPTTVVKLVNRNHRWLVQWSRATINPALRPGDRLGVFKRWPTRAPILGAGGAALTTQRPLISVGIVGRRVKNRRAVSADLLAAGATSTEVRQALAQATAHPDFFDPVFTITLRRFAQLKAQPGPANVYAVPGTQFERTSARTAITAQLAAQLVGAIGPVTAQELAQLGRPYDVASVVGQHGLEEVYERRLAGTPQTRVDVVDAGGAPVTRLATFGGSPARPVVTSIDPAVQRAAEAALAGQRGNAALVAMRASTGQILAAVSDPAGYAYDQALEGEYPPGSTFKVLTSTALFRAGLSPGSPASCPPSITVDGETFHNAEGDRPVQTLEQGFAESCNTTFITLALAHLKPAGFTATARLYGLDQPPRPGLPAFLAAVPAPAGRTELAATTIGQARVVFSPLGLATVAAAIDSGAARAPRLVTGAPDDARPAMPLPAGVNDDLRQMMGEVVATGTASGTGLPSATHAKTGTAQYGSGATLHTDAWLMGYDADIAFAIVVQDSRGVNGGPLDGPIIARFLNALGSGA